jgi:hypothetical protein
MHPDITPSDRAGGFLLKLHKIASVQHSISLGTVPIFPDAARTMTDKEKVDAP